MSIIRQQAVTFSIIRQQALTLSIIHQQALTLSIIHQQAGPNTHLSIIRFPALPPLAPAHVAANVSSEVCRIAHAQVHVQSHLHRRGVSRQAGATARLRRLRFKASDVNLKLVALVCAHYVGVWSAH